jgi:hypothetical protein
LSERRSVRTTLGRLQLTPTRTSGPDENAAGFPRSAPKIETGDHAAVPLRSVVLYPSCTVPASAGRFPLSPRCIAARRRSALQQRLARRGVHRTMTVGPAVRSCRGIGESGRATSDLQPLQHQRACHTLIQLTSRRSRLADVRRNAELAGSPARDDKLPLTARTIYPLALVLTAGSNRNPPEHLLPSPWAARAGALDGHEGDLGTDGPRPPREAGKVGTPSVCETGSNLAHHK